MFGLKPSLANRCRSCGAPLREKTDVGPLTEGQICADMVLVILAATFVWCGCEPLGISEPATEKIVVENRADRALDVRVCPGGFNCGITTSLAWFEGLRGGAVDTQDVHPPWDKSGEFLVRTWAGDVERSGAVGREGAVARIVVDTDGVR